MTTDKKFDGDMAGIFGPNSFKTEAKHPDIRGRERIRGIWFWMSAWQKKNADGSIYWTSSFTEMTAEEAKKYEDQLQARLAAKNNPTPQQGSWGAQQQPQQQQAQTPVKAQDPAGNPLPNSEPPVDFDDDIPF